MPEIIKIIEEKETQNQKKKQKNKTKHNKTKNKDRKEQGRTEAIVKGWELNYFVACLGSPTNM